MTLPEQNGAKHRRLAAALVLALLAPLPTAGAKEEIAGPIDATVLRVIDGDTVVVRARIWLGQVIETHVRLAGIDAPEIHAHCEREALLAEKAKAFVEAKLVDADVTIADVTNDKYGGRVVARMVTARGEDIGKALLAAGLAHPYDGRKKAPWCDGT